MVWVSYIQQLWAKLRYSPGTNALLIVDLLEEGGHLHKLCFNMLLYLGVNRRITAQWRHIYATFGSIGLYRVLREVIIARLNLFP